MRWRSIPILTKAAEKGYDVLVLDGQLDTHLINTLESKDHELKVCKGRQ
ncbi:MAG: hypothetical protein MZV63_19980 [Marinilabiliales bacterium]|nr:hypothetical protein [Marinilabiliales bacterium]